MNEIEEDLVFTLETIMEKFDEKMAPHAFGLCQNLAAAFSKGIHPKLLLMMLMIQVLCCRWLFACHKYNSGIGIAA